MSTRRDEEVIVEGNECYKFSTIRNFIERTAAKPIRVMIDAGTNVGDITLMMSSYFPEARIYGFEVVEEYYEIALSRTAHLPNIKLYNIALTSQHLYADDLGAKPRQQEIGLTVLKGLPEAGPGWIGGSMVLPGDHQMVSRVDRPFGYEKTDRVASPMTLSEFMRAEGLDEIDLMKLDCEGCEHSVLGCADLDTLRRIRFLTGEYHGLDRFYDVMQAKLFQTHKVNLIGARSLGCFFGERLEGNADGILRFDKTGMLIPRPWLSERAIDWHLFDEQYVGPEDRFWHALA
jgi:FkbM family methyltransferase